MRPSQHPELPGLILCRLQSVGDGTYRPVPEKLHTTADGETWVSARKAAEVLGLSWKPSGGCEPLRRLRCSEYDGNPLIRFRKITKARYEYELNSLARHKVRCEDPKFYDKVIWNGL